MYKMAVYEDFSGIPWLVHSFSCFTKKEAYDSVKKFVSQCNFKVIESEIDRMLDSTGEYVLTNDVTLVIENEEENNFDKE